MRNEKYKSMSWEPSNWMWKGQTTVSENMDSIHERLAMGINCICGAIIIFRHIHTKEDLPEPSHHSKIWIGWDYGTLHQYKTVMET